jgi:UDP-glucose 4-epimerase
VAVERDAPRPGDVLRLCADVARASSLLRYRPHVSLEEGLHQLMAWYGSLGVGADALLEQEVVRNWTVPQPL